MYRNIKTPRYKFRCYQGGKRVISKKHSLAVREDCKKKAGLQLSPVGRLSAMMSRKLKSTKPSLHSSSLNRSTACETRAARVSSAMGRARPPTVKEQAAKYLVKLNVVTSVTCCFIPGCFEKVTGASSDLSAAISCEFTENGGGTMRGQTWCLSLTKGVAGELHTCQLHLPQIFLGVDQTTVCKY